MYRLICGYYFKLPNRTVCGEYESIRRRGRHLRGLSPSTQVSTLSGLAGRNCAARDRVAQRSIDGLIPPQAQQREAGAPAGKPGTAAKWWNDCPRLVACEATPGAAGLCGRRVATHVERDDSPNALIAAVRPCEGGDCQTRKSVTYAGWPRAARPESCVLLARSRRRARVLARAREIVRGVLGVAPVNSRDCRSAASRWASRDGDNTPSDEWPR